MSKSNSNIFDLGSESQCEDFDPFASDDDTGKSTGEALAQKALKAPNNQADTKEPDKDQKDFADKPPVFEYAGAAENIEDTAKTFEELRIEKSDDFPELEDGKRVSWALEYGKVNKTVNDPKGVSIGKMKTDIEESKEFLDSMKKAKDKNPICKVKPRVTAQSKGTVSAYKGVFANMDEAEAAGKAISIVPARDGKVYEIRSTEMGRFITPVTDCEMLCQIKAGFFPALPRIPSDLMMKVIAFFRHFTRQGDDYEALLNIYWDKVNKEFIVDAPSQTVTKITVDSQISSKFADERYIHYMDIHSHNTMGAFFSQVDDNDEKATRLYTVIGKLNECVPEIKTRISNGGKFLDISPALVFECAGVPFPEEWKRRVSFRSVHTKIKRKPFSRLLMLRNKMKRGVDCNALCFG